jgi:hypothetical protein
MLNYIIVFDVFIYYKLFVYNKRSGSAGVRHSIYYAFSVGVMNWFEREKDDYMFLYESYYLFSYIIDISVNFGFVINDYTSRTQGCVTNMLASLEWQTLEQRRRISRLVMMYKIQHQLVDIDRDLYLRPGDSRTRGVADCFKFCGTRHARHTQLMSPRL